MRAKFLQWCLTLCSPINCSLPGSSVHGILQARILEWVVIPSPRGSSQPRDWIHISCIDRQVLYHLGSPVLSLLLLLSHFSRVRLCVTPQSVAHQAPPSWDSPGKNTGVGCHFLLQCMKVKSESEVAQSCPTLATPWTAACQAPPFMGFSRQKVFGNLYDNNRKLIQSHSPPTVNILINLFYHPLTVL